MDPQEGQYNKIKAKIPLIFKGWRCLTANPFSFPAIALSPVIAVSLTCSCSKTEPVVATLPILTTETITAITQTTAVCGGNVTSGGGLTVSARGVCWSVNPAPTTSSDKTLDSAGTGTFISHLAGLSQGTSYFIRAYATNARGTAYGEERAFSTLPSDTGIVTDIDGNVYHTVTIGTQVWLKENMRAVRYGKGDSIPHIEDGTEWGELNKGAYCNYDKNPANGTTYGRLYNWYAVNDYRNICPEGWHIPTDAEWQILTGFLGGDIVAGGKLKATGTLGQGDGLWQDPNADATNESGFSALPGGFRTPAGNFSMLSENAMFWTSTADQARAWNRELSFKYGNAEKHSRELTYGYSVRCIKDK